MAKEERLMKTRTISVSLAILLIIISVLVFGTWISFAGTVNLPKTGQTKCYDAIDGSLIDCEGTGQDGDIQAGIEWPQPRFSDNGDGTLTDNLTGLMWLKDGACLGPMKTWQWALDRVADFNKDPVKYNCTNYTASHTDWVLPNVNELESLLNVEDEGSRGWLASQGFLNIAASYYWSSTTITEDTNSAWSFNTTKNYVIGLNKPDGAGWQPSIQ